MFNIYQFNSDNNTSDRKNNREIHVPLPQIKKLAQESLNDPDTSVVFSGVFILKNLVFSNPH
jgi:hypothetical protein